MAPQLAKRRTVATTFPQVVGRSPDEAVQATVEGLLLGAYRFDRYKSGKNEDHPEKPALRTVTVLGSPRWTGRAVVRSLEESIARGDIVSDAVAWARDLVNTPAGDLTPEDLAGHAAQMAKEVGLECKVWTEAELQRGKFGGILGVGQGSVNPPRMIELKYKGGPSGQAPIALTGKGITFDSGGLSIKDAAGMEWMKSDMAGAASILAALKAIARLKPNVNVIAAIPSSENMPSGSAIRPGDVLKHRGGKTSEVVNTDAEGRLVLADALAYLAERKPRVIIDTATLTGACMVALGATSTACSATTAASSGTSWPPGKRWASPGGSSRCTATTATSSSRRSPTSETRARTGGAGPSRPRCSSPSSWATRPGLTWTSPARRSRRRPATTGRTARPAYRPARWCSTC